MRLIDADALFAVGKQETKEHDLATALNAVLRWMN